MCSNHELIFANIELCDEQSYHNIEKWLEIDNGSTYSKVNRRLYIYIYIYVCVCVCVCVCVHNKTCPTNLYSLTKSKDLILPYQGCVYHACIYLYSKWGLDKLKSLMSKSRVTIEIVRENIREKNSIVWNSSLFEFVINNPISCDINTVSLSKKQR